MIFTSMLLVIIAFIVLICLFNRLTHKRVYAEIKQFSDALSAGDIEEVNKQLFGSSENISDEGIISTVIPYIKIKLFYVSKNQIVLCVKSPRINDLAEILSSEDKVKIEKQISDKIDKYKKKTTVIRLSYIPFPDNDIINYQDYEFINAITAGMLDEYQKLKEGVIYIDPQDYIEN